jgi:nuclear pore complex protein Nup98-Nup96
VTKASTSLGTTEPLRDFSKPVPLYRGEITPAVVEPVIRFTTIEPKDGYITSPSFAELKEMPAVYLRKVPHFTIHNAFGKIEFLDPVDLTDTDLSNVVEIVKGEAIVYSESDELQGKKPPVGSKLNVPAEITLNGYTARKEKFERKIQAYCAEKDCEHVKYDQGRGEWTFRVQHFTKWGIVMSSDEEESEEEEKQMEVESEEEKSVEEQA